jgi:hypothetical protein
MMVTVRVADFGLTSTAPKAKHLSTRRRRETFWAGVCLSRPSSVCSTKSTRRSSALCCREELGPRDRGPRRVPSTRATRRLRRRSWAGGWPSRQRPPLGPACELPASASRCQPPGAFPRIHFFTFFSIHRSASSASDFAPRPLRSLPPKLTDTQRLRGVARMGVGTQEACAETRESTAAARALRLSTPRPIVGRRAWREKEGAAEPQPGMAFCANLAESAAGKKKRADRTPPCPCNFFTCACRAETEHQHV